MLIERERGELRSGRERERREREGGGGSNSYFNVIYGPINNEDQRQRMINIRCLLDEIENGFKSALEIILCLLIIIILIS